MSDYDERDYGEDFFFAPDETLEINLIFDKICKEKEVISDLYRTCKEQHWVSAFYRFYHNSYKVYGVQKSTLEIVDLFRSFMPALPLNQDFDLIVKQGTGLVWTSEDNKNWVIVTRPILEAYWHAMMFLESMLVCIEEMDRPRVTISEEWGAVLYLYNLRQER